MNSSKRTSKKIHKPKPTSLKRNPNIKEPTTNLKHDFDNTEKTTEDNVTRSTSAGIKSFLWKKPEQSQDHTIDQVPSDYSSTWDSVGKADGIAATQDNDDEDSCTDESTDIWQVDPSTAEKVLVAFARYMRDHGKVGNMRADKNDWISSEVTPVDVARDGSVSLSDEDKIAMISLAEKLRSEKIVKTSKSPASGGLNAPCLAKKDSVKARGSVTFRVSENSSKHNKAGKRERTQSELGGSHRREKRKSSNSRNDKGQPNEKKTPPPTRNEIDTRLRGEKSLVCDTQSCEASRPQHKHVTRQRNSVDAKYYRHSGSMNIVTKDGAPLASNTGGENASIDIGRFESKQPKVSELRLIYEKGSGDNSKQPAQTENATSVDTSKQRVTVVGHNTSSRRNSDILLANNPADRVIEQNANSSRTDCDLSSSPSEESTIYSNGTNYGYDDHDDDDHGDNDDDDKQSLVDQTQEHIPLKGKRRFIALNKSASRYSAECVQGLNKLVSDLEKKVKRQDRMHSPQSNTLRALKSYMSSEDYKHLHEIHKKNTSRPGSVDGGITPTGGRGDDFEYDYLRTHDDDHHHVRNKRLTSPNTGDTIVRQTGHSRKLAKSDVYKHLVDYSRPSAVLRSGGDQHRRYRHFTAKDDTLTGTYMDILSRRQMMLRESLSRDSSLEGNSPMIENYGHEGEYVGSGSRYRLSLVSKYPHLNKYFNLDATESSEYGSAISSNSCSQGNVIPAQNSPNTNNMCGNTDRCKIPVKGKNTLVRNLPQVNVATIGLTTRSNRRLLKKSPRKPHLNTSPMQQWKDMIESLYLPLEVKRGLKIAVIVLGILWLVVLIKSFFAFFAKPDKIVIPRRSIRSIRSIAERIWGL